MKKHLQPTTFKIYNASAGSGKTHTLVKEYLKIALSQSNSFKNILALTFTNKAVNEMKERVLNSLYDFSLSQLPEKSKSLFNDLQKELNLSTKDLQKKSGITLKLILHNYAYFDISTIDKFNHRIIRTFAKDLKLPQNFEPVVDTDLMLNEAISSVVQKVGSDEQLTKILLEFALEKIDDNRSWDISFDLEKIGKLIFNENHAHHLEKLNLKKISDFLELKKTLVQRITTLEKQIIADATHILQEIENNGLQFSDFSGAYFPKLLKKICDHNFDLDFEKAWVLKFESSPLYPKRIPNETKLIIDGLQANFATLFNTIQTSISQYRFLKNIQRNIVPLTVLNTIQQEVKNIEKERDQIPIFKFNQLISKEIKNQPAPFIYERLGEKYQHYFIDEFQDTSAAQWNNLVPLIDNALASEGGFLFLVGDAKQAIYRWRGGKAEQFINLANGIENPFVIEAETKNLPVNYRSNEALIKFNNEFFTWSSSHLNNQTYQELYIAGNKQETNSKKEGYVKLTFVTKEIEKHPNEFYCEQVLAAIDETQSKNYQLKDIVILVRRKSDSFLLADYLSEKNVPIISSESLLLKSSSKVRFLVNLIQYASGFREATIAYEILAYLAPCHTDRHQYIYNNLKQLETFLETTYNFSLARISKLSTYDSLEYAIRQFNIAPKSDAYVVFLMDFTLDIEKREGGSIQTFINHWEKKKEKLAISSPDNIDAIRIMTIHKSKGLEFPVVIFPFADAKIYDRKDKMMWSAIDPKDFNGFSEVLLTEKNEVTNYPNDSASIFNNEVQMMELDAMNVLYVAHTRAEKALFIITQKNKSASNNSETKRYSDLYTNYLQNKNLWQDEQVVYSFGALEEKPTEDLKKQKSDTYNYQYSYRDKPHFNLVTTAGMLWNTERKEAISHGTLVHYILGLIETKDDIQSALTTLVQTGDILEDEITLIKDTIYKVLNHEKLNEFFTKKYTTLNERDILTSKGKLLRPDRISICENQVTIIDYKTGKKNPKYKEQLYAYADALTEMNYIIKNKILVYITNEVNLEFI